MQWPLSALFPRLLSDVGRVIIVRYDRAPTIIVIKVIKHSTMSYFLLFVPCLFDFIDESLYFSLHNAFFHIFYIAFSGGIYFRYS